MYGKVTIIKALLIPKMVYLFPLIPTLGSISAALLCRLRPSPRSSGYRIKSNSQKFWWKGTDKVTRVSTINDYEKGDLKMINLECMIKSFRLAWLKRMFSSNRGSWKSNLRHLLAKYGGIFLV